MHCAPANVKHAQQCLPAHAADLASWSRVVRMYCCQWLRRCQCLPACRYAENPKEATEPEPNAQTGKTNESGALHSENVTKSALPRPVWYLVLILAHVPASR